MTQHILLQDHWIASAGVLKAGDVLGSDEPRYTQAVSTFAPLAPYVPATMDPVVSAYLAVSLRLPKGSAVSLYAMMRSAGLIP